jgi:hypothetical protein
MKAIALLRLAEAAVDRFLREPDEDAAMPALVEPDPFYFHLCGVEPPIGERMSARLLAALREGRGFIQHLGKHSPPAAARAGGTSARLAPVARTAVNSSRSHAAL